MCFVYVFYGNRLLVFDLICRPQYMYVDHPKIREVPPIHSCFSLLVNSIAGTWWSYCRFLIGESIKRIDKPGVHEY